MPNQPKTPLRSFRVSDDVWQAALHRAQREGTTLTAVLVEALEEYGRDDRKHADEQDG